jgi:UDP-glucose 4-epimerase
LRRQASSIIRWARAYRGRDDRVLKHTFDVATQPKRVVVIGAAGFVGGASVARLRRYGAQVLGLGRTDIDLSADGGAQRLAEKLQAGDAVVAVAARAPCKNIDMLIDNMKMVQTMLDAMKHVEISHLVNISSDAVYGDEPVPLTEDAPAAPGSLHGAMHLAREIAFASSGIAPLAILRPTLIYGKADPHNGYGPNRFVRQARGGEAIALFGEGEERRDHVSVEDVAEIVARVVLRRSVGTLNVASGEVHSFADAANLAIAATGSKSRLVPSPRTGPMPHNGYRPFDIAALTGAFPDLVPTRLPAGIKAMAGAAT